MVLHPPFLQASHAAEAKPHPGAAHRSEPEARHEKCLAKEQGATRNVASSDLFGEGGGDYDGGNGVWCGVEAGGGGVSTVTWGYQGVFIRSRGHISMVLR